ncbi:MAG TPA: hypothetical protein VEH76_09935 [Methylocystis sp.]|nr:hypothetical protein [Methylocystis sp.]
MPPAKVGRVGLSLLESVSRGRDLLVPSSERFAVVKMVSWRPERRRYGPPFISRRAS